jgi:hypothetical protein
LQLVERAHHVLALIAPCSPNGDDTHLALQ